MQRGREYENNSHHAKYPRDLSEKRRNYRENVGRPRDKDASFMPKEKFKLPRVAASVHRPRPLQGPVYPVRSPDTGPIDPAYVSGDVGYKGVKTRDRQSGYPTRRGRTKRRGCSSRVRLGITLGVVFVIMAVTVAVTVAAVWRPERSKDSDTSLDTYETSLRLTSRSYSDQLVDITSDLFRTTQEDICSAIKTIFDGAVSNCVVDAFSNGSLVVQSSVDFDVAQLAKLVTKRSDDTAIRTLELLLPLISSGASVAYVRKEPTFLTFQLHTRMNLAQTVDSKTRYCKAIRDVYGDSLHDCEVTTLGSDRVTSTIRMKTKLMKTLARSKQLKSDRAGIAYVVGEKLANNTIEFFSSHNFSKALSEVEEISSSAVTTSRVPLTSTSAADMTSGTSLPETTQTSGSESVANAATDGPTTQAAVVTAEEITAVDTTDEATTVGTTDEATTVGTTDETTTVGTTDETTTVGTTDETTTVGTTDETTTVVP